LKVVANFVGSNDVTEPVEPQTWARRTHRVAIDGAIAHAKVYRLRVNDSGSVNEIGSEADRASRSRGDDYRCDNSECHEHSLCQHVQLLVQFRAMEQTQQCGESPRVPEPNLNGGRQMMRLVAFRQSGRVFRQSGVLGFVSAAIFAAHH
jgi:hypothetical protein